MKTKRRCPRCQKPFIPRHGKRQVTCCSAQCQHQQKIFSHRRWKHKNRKVYRDALDDWRNNHPGYWRKYRASHPDYAERNRHQTRWRKSLSKLGLQKRNTVPQPLELQMKFWNFPRFAKERFSTFSLLCAYTHSRAIDLTIINRRNL